METEQNDFLDAEECSAFDAGTSDAPPAADAKMLVTGFPCANCGHHMTYSPTLGKLYCSYCKGEKQVRSKRLESPEYLYDPETDKWETPNWAEAGNRVLACPSCGAETLRPAKAMTVECPFCGSDYVNELPATDAVIPPETMLPFTVSEEEAHEAFKRYTKKRFFAPFGFRKRIASIKTNGIYLPAFTFDTDTETAYRGQGGRHRTECYTTRVNGKTVTRTRTVTDWYPIHGRSREELDDILTLASRMVDEKLFYAIAPYSTKVMQTFHPAYLAGFYAERYDIGPTDGFLHAKEVAYRSMENKIQSRDNNYDCYRMMDYDHSFRKVSFKHILLPVWLASYQYGKKRYLFLVNGETGRVAGKTPLSKLKIVLLSLLGAATVAAVVLLIVLSEMGIL